MFQIGRLLSFEYFPVELPPCFNTFDLANKSEQVYEAIMMENRDFSVPLKYSGYKSESSRRRFAIPNPYHYCKVVKIIVDNENVLSGIFKQSPYSLTAPISNKPRDGQAYAKRSANISESKKEIECLYQNNKYEIRLDINSFFDNIYTHSIPWAIHTIKVAKANTNNEDLLGNCIDRAMRSLNYNQTNGILIGNAVSRIVSEIILCTIDAEIKDSFPEILCRRFVDDYYIYTTDNSKIQQIISFIRNKLATYELNLNENKIQINESPFLYGKPWVEKIKQYIHLSPDLFLTKLISEFKLYKDISIFKYGLKILYHCRFNKKDWAAMQSKLTNLWVRFPSLSDIILKILLANRENLKPQFLKKAIYDVIDESIILNREQELIWAVWFIKIIDISVSQEYICKVLDSKNDLAIIIMLDIVKSNERNREPKIKSSIENLHNYLAKEDTDDKGQRNQLMWSSHWLLAYEATKNKWLNLPDKPFEFAKKVVFFKKLLENSVKFYDTGYSYPLEDTGNNTEYVTRKELYAAINRLRSSVISKKIFNKKTDSAKIVEDLGIEKSTYDKIIALIEDGEDFYI